MSQPNTLEKHGSTMFLRATVVALGLIAVGLCALVLPAVFSHWSEEYPDIAHLRYPVLLILSATVVPFFIALYQTLKLLNFVDQNKAFSKASVEALGKIKYSAVIFGALYAAFLPIDYLIAQEEDAPGLVVIGMMMTAAPIVIAVFAAVLQKLLQSAIAIKFENDLTV